MHAHNVLLVHENNNKLRGEIDTYDQTYANAHKRKYKIIIATPVTLRFQSTEQTRTAPAKY